MLLSDSDARGSAERLATLEDGDSNTLNCTVVNDNALSEGHSAGLAEALDTTRFVERWLDGLWNGVHLVRIVSML